jgi:hypothetical protein
MLIALGRHRHDLPADQLDALVLVENSRRRHCSSSATVKRRRGKPSAAVVVILGSGRLMVQFIQAAIGAHPLPTAPARANPPG